MTDFKPMRVRINRDEWAHSLGDGNGTLCAFDADTGKPQRCCLGFYMNDLGFSDGEIAGRGMPFDLIGSDHEEYERTRASVMDTLAGDNDAYGRTRGQAALEERLKETAVTIGIEFEFYGGDERPEEERDYVVQYRLEEDDKVRTSSVFAGVAKARHLAEVLEADEGNIGVYDVIIRPAEDVVDGAD